MLHTNSWSCVGARIFFNVLCSGVAAGLLILANVNRDRPITDPALDELILIGMTGAFFGTGILLSFSFHRGTWLISQKGLTHAPPFRRPRSLQWAEIDRVQWDENLLNIRRGSIRISIPWSMLPPQEAAAARDRVERRLARDFDLTPFEVFSELQEKAPISIYRIIRLTGIGVLTLTLWCASVLILTLVWPAHREWIANAFLFTLILPMLAPVPYELQKLRERREVNPNHPWRVRGWRVPEWARKGKGSPDLLFHE